MFDVYDVVLWCCYFHLQARYSPDYEYEGGRVGGHSHSRRSRLDEHSHRGRDSYMDSYSHRDSFSYRDSYSHRDRERESFDGVLRASQVGWRYCIPCLNLLSCVHMFVFFCRNLCVLLLSIWMWYHAQNLFQRQLATLRDRLATINHDTSSSVAASINLPNYTSSGHTWAAPRRNVSSSLSAIKGDFQSQRHEQQNKLMKALLVVRWTRLSIYLSTWALFTWEMLRQQNLKCTVLMVNMCVC